jgi:alpha-amylase
LWFSGYAQDKDLVQHIKTMNAARKAAIAANSRFLSVPVRPHDSLDFLGTNGR